MKYLLDTCVLSEFVKPSPDAGVLEFLSRCDEASLFLSVLTLGEIQRGIERLPSSKRKTALRDWLDHDLRKRFSERLLDVNEVVALAWGAKSARAEREGRPLPAVDALIAATAQVYDLTVVTRNDVDLCRSKVDVHNPWSR